MLNISDFLNQKIIEAANKLSIDNELDARPYSTAILPQMRVDSTEVLLANISSNYGAAMPIVADGNSPVEDTFGQVKLNKVALMHTWVTATKSDFTTQGVLRKLKGMAANGAMDNKEAQIIANSLFAKLFYDRVQRWLDLQTLQFNQLVSNPYGFVTSGDVHNDVYSYTLSGVAHTTGSLADFAANPITSLITNVIDPATRAGSYPDTVFIGTGLTNLFINSPAFKSSTPTPSQFDFIAPADGVVRVAKNARLIFEYPGVQIISINDRVTTVSKATGKMVNIQSFDEYTAVAFNSKNLGAMLWAPTWREDLMAWQDEKLSFYQVGDGVYPEKTQNYRSEANVLCAVTGTDTMARCVYLNDGGSTGGSTGGTENGG